MSFNDFAFDNSYMPDQSAAMNKGVTPIFFVEPVENPRKSEDEGRPIFDELERVRIVVAGDAFSASVQPVTEEIVERFPTQYAAFKRKAADHHISETPITEWPILTRSQASELHAIKIFSVENLAAVSDANIVRLGPNGRELRAKAQAYLEVAKDGAAVANLARENVQLKDEVTDLKVQMKGLADRLAALDAEKGGDGARGKAKAA